MVVVGVVSGWRLYGGGGCRGIVGVGVLAMRQYHIWFSLCGLCCRFISSYLLGSRDGRDCVGSDGDNHTVCFT